VSAQVKARLLCRKSCGCYAAECSMQQQTCRQCMCSPVDCIVHHVCCCVRQQLLQLRDALCTLAATAQHRRVSAPNQST
jgi:hypothetical protein